jgi:hypothetical protein
MVLVGIPAIYMLLTFLFAAIVDRERVNYFGLAVAGILLAIPILYFLIARRRPWKCCRCDGVETESEPPEGYELSDIDFVDLVEIDRKNIEQDRRKRYDDKHGSSGPPPVPRKKKKKATDKSAPWWNDKSPE